MPPIQYVSPAYRKAGFTCAICGVYAKQEWGTEIYSPSGLGLLAEFAASRCQHCAQTSMWHDQFLIFPSVGTAPLPNDDLPADMLTDYNEARRIVAISPRGAAALLRLVIQKLCKFLGEKGENPNNDIAGLVEKGLPKGVQKALDAVRVIGNEAVHPGEINFGDNPEIAASLFGLVNFIVEKMISEPKEIEAIYKQIPEKKRNAIERRDTKKS